MSITFNRRVDVTDPDDRLAWRDIDGNLRNFTGWSFSMEIIDPATNTIAYLKQAGIAGSDGTGLSNVAIAWTPEEMEPLAGPKRWRGRILANLGAERTEFVVDDAKTLPIWVFEAAPTVPVVIP